MRTKPILALATSSNPPPSHITPKCVIAGLPYWHSTEAHPRQPLPTRDADDDCLAFGDYPEFRPNLSPDQIFRAGAFGGTYYRPITSKSAKRSFPVGVYREFPPDWFDGIDVSRAVASGTYRKEVNKYGVKSGNDLDFWENKGWMRSQDPYGWFQWYCRFYLGRRSDDDNRQVSRWVKAIGDKGRWRTFLVGQCVKKGAAWDDASASPVTRQTLLHWGYELTESEFNRLAGPIRKGKSVIYLGRVAPQNEADNDTKTVSSGSRSNQRSSAGATRKSKRQKRTS